MCGNKAKMIRGWCRVIWKESLNIEATRFYRRVKAFYNKRWLESGCAHRAPSQQPSIIVAVRIGENPVPPQFFFCDNDGRRSRMPKIIKKKPKVSKKITLMIYSMISELRSDEAEAAGEADMLEEALEHYEKTGQLRRCVRESYMFPMGAFASPL